MSIADRWTLGSRVAGALCRIALDRVEEGWGTALPRTPAQLADPDVVNALVRDHAPASHRPPLPTLRDVRSSGVEFESSNCTNFLIDLDFEASQGEASADALPKTAYVKLPCRQRVTRAFAHAVGFWEVEYHFCRHVASRVPIRVPRVYAAARSGARFVLLLENLHELPGSRLFVNRDMAAGTTVERARMCLDTLAELHATFWDLGREDRERLLPSRLHTYLAPGGRALTRALNRAAIAPAHARAPEVFTREHVATCERAVERWDALVDAWYRAPLTLIHGDSHLANSFEYPTPEGPRMGMIDFQGMQWCHGMRDVQYFLVNSLEPDLLASHESELIDHYVAALGRHGVELGGDEARERYRAFSFQTLMVAVVSLGLGSLTEREATIRTILRRSAAASRRLGFGEWLESL